MGSQSKWEGQDSRADLDVSTEVTSVYEEGQRWWDEGELAGYCQG